MLVDRKRRAGPSRSAAQTSKGSGISNQPRKFTDRRADLCSAADELSAQQKEEELLNISVQQLYVLITLGKIEAAEQLAGEIASDTYGIYFSFGLKVDSLQRT